jgi:hypothetical protein
MSQHASLARASIILYLLLMFLLIVVVVVLWGFFFSTATFAFYERRMVVGNESAGLLLRAFSRFRWRSIFQSKLEDYSADTTCVGVSLACCVVHPRLREHMVERLVKFY